MGCKCLNKLFNKKEREKAQEPIIQEPPDINDLQPNVVDPVPPTIEEDPIVNDTLTPSNDFDIIITSTDPVVSNDSPKPVVSEDPPKPKFASCLKDLIQPMSDAAYYFNTQKDVYKHIYFCGSSKCNYLYWDYINVLMIVARSIYEDFPDYRDRRMSIGDACCREYTEKCAGHPNHVGRKRVDLNYYTFNTNMTQYIPHWETQSSLTPLWDNGYLLSNLLPVFDWERNFLVYKRLHDVVPDIEFLVNTGIFKMLYKKVQQYYPEHLNTMFQLIVDTGETKWRHCTHTHIEFDKKKVGPAKFIEWDKECGWIKRLEI